MFRFALMSVLIFSYLAVNPLAQAQPVEGEIYRITSLGSKNDLGMSELQDEADKIIQVEAGESRNQQWKFVKVGDYYNIINHRTGKAMNVKGGSKEIGGEVILWDAIDNNAENQQWFIEDQINHFVIKARHSDLVLDVGTISTDREYQAIQVVYKKDSLTQQFQLTKIAKLEERDTYRITNLGSKNDLSMSVLKDEADKIIQVNAGESPGQQWKFVKVGDYYNIINQRTGKAMNVKSNSKEVGGEVILWDAIDNNAENQQWSIEKKGNHYVIKARHSDLVLDVGTISTDREYQLIQVAYKKNSLTQQFQLNKIVK